MARKHRGIFHKTSSRCESRVLTGLAQMRGWRGDTSVEERPRLDIRNILRPGPGQGPLILVCTIAKNVGNPHESQLRDSIAASHRSQQGGLFAGFRLGE